LTVRLNNWGLRKICVLIATRHRSAWNHQLWLEPIVNKKTASSSDRMVQQHRPLISSTQQKALLLASSTQWVVRNQTRSKCAKLWLTTLSKPKTCLATQLSRSSCQLENKQKPYCLQSRRPWIWDRVQNQAQSFKMLFRICTKLKVPKPPISWLVRKKTKLGFKNQRPGKYCLLRLLHRRLIKQQIVKRSWQKSRSQLLKLFNWKNLQQWRSISPKLN
jgi:hypothetical protein